MIICSNLNVKGLFPNDVSAYTTYVVINLMTGDDEAWYLVDLKMMRDFPFYQSCEKTVFLAIHYVN